MSERNGLNNLEQVIAPWWASISPSVCYPWAAQNDVRVESQQQ